MPAGARRGRYAPAFGRRRVPRDFGATLRLPPEIGSLLTPSAAPSSCGGPARPGCCRTGGRSRAERRGSPPGNDATAPGGAGRGSVSVFLAGGSLRRNRWSVRPLSLMKQRLRSLLEGPERLRFQRRFPGFVGGHPLSSRSSLAGSSAAAPLRPRRAASRSCGCLWRDDPPTPGPVVPAPRPETTTPGRGRRRRPAQRRRASETRHESERGERASDTSVNDQSAATFAPTLREFSPGLVSPCYFMAYLCSYDSDKLGRFVTMRFERSTSHRYIKDTL